MCTTTTATDGRLARKFSMRAFWPRPARPACARAGVRHKTARVLSPAMLAHTGAAPRDFPATDEVHNNTQLEENSHGVCRWFCGSGEEVQTRCLPGDCAPVRRDLA